MSTASHYTETCIKYTNNNNQNNIKVSKYIKLNLCTLYFGDWIYWLKSHSVFHYVIVLCPTFQGYVTNILEDARVYSEHAQKKELDVSDVKLAVQTRVDHSFTAPPPRDVS